MLNFEEDSYLERSTRPVYSLIFLLPFIVFYEIGTILSSTDALSQTQDRVVAFIWLQAFLDRYVGLDGRLAWIAPPLAVVVVLIGLQLASRKRWSFAVADFGPMTVECILLGVPLIVLSLFLSGPAGRTRYDAGSSYTTVRTQTEAIARCFSSAGDGSGTGTREGNADESRRESLLANIVTGIGAGIYEELVFRLVLMCVLMVVLQDLMGLSHKTAIILAVLVSAALFSAHHHVVLINGRLASGYPFSWKEFSFRTIAGVYFAVLFAIRGFGITAGTHAFYDIMATMINAVFFDQWRM